VVGVLVTALGLAASALVAWRPTAAGVVVTAVVLGTGYGILLVTGLDRVERLADRHEFAALVSVFYSLAYLGFATPYLLATLADGVAYAPWLAAAALTSLAAIPLTLLGGRAGARTSTAAVSPLVPVSSAEGDRHG
jgi:hypothetical protein